MTRPVGNHRRWQGLVFLCAFILVVHTRTRAAAADACDQAFNHSEVVAALADIQRSVDPCGQSSQITRLLDAFRDCARDGYAICINREAARNTTDQSQDEHGSRVAITWNPDLHSELETGCAGDPRRAVLRDPTASLLHEIAHAVQHCAGLDPNAFELETVRIENIYRRARHLCQRTAYGTQPLPPAMVIACEPGHCQCTPGAVQVAGAHRPIAPAQAVVPAGDGTASSR